MATSNLTVSGMTCNHCVQSVQSEIGKLDGVTSVEVDLASGQVTIQSNDTLDPSALAAAVDEAGYEVVT